MAPAERLAFEQCFAGRMRGVCFMSVRVQAREHKFRNALATFPQYSHSFNTWRLYWILHSRTHRNAVAIQNAGPADSEGILPRSSSREFLGGPVKNPSLAAQLATRLLNEPQANKT
eukprot:5522785-Amphidinium_carterae.1